MVMEIRELRSSWQDQRQSLLRADYNHADEELARVLFFANNSPIISNILSELRNQKIYQSFSAKDWLEGRGDANVLGAGNTNLRFSLENIERASQCLSVLEMAVSLFDDGKDSLWIIGCTTYGGQSTKIIDSIRSAIDVIFEPFFTYVDRKLRTLETLITPMDIINNIQVLVDTAVSEKYPSTHKLLVEVYKHLFSLSASSSPNWNQIGYSCRDIIIDFANLVFNASFVPPGIEIPKKDDAKEKLKLSVRHHLKESDVGDRYRQTVEQIIKVNWDFINIVGHRQSSSTEDDARLAVVYTYLSIFLVDKAIFIKA